MKPSHCTPYIYTIFVNYTSIKLKKDPRINHGRGGGASLVAQIVKNLSAI